MPTRTQEPSYQMRFVPEADRNTLINLYHTAKTALAGGDDSKHKRRIKAAEWYHKDHPEISQTAIYKDLCGITEL
jgi:hypothetical protein